MEKGDHLISSRLGYSHHGLYIGNDEVIHYSGFSEFLDKGSIETTSLSEFSQGNSIRVKIHLVPVFDSDERVNRAYEKLGEDKYNLAFNNCEHFVNWCFNGLKSSSQVNNVVSATRFVANEYMKKEAAKTVAANIAVKSRDKVATEVVRHAVTASVVKSSASTFAGTAAGVAAATAVTGTTAIAAVASAPVALPLAAAVGAGIGVKKALDWLFD